MAGRSLRAVLWSPETARQGAVAELTVQGTAAGAPGSGTAGVQAMRYPVGPAGRWPRPCPVWASVNRP